MHVIVEKTPYHQTMHKLAKTYAGSAPVHFSEDALRPIYPGSVLGYVKVSSPQIHLYCIIILGLCIVVNGKVDVSTVWLALSPERS